MKKEYLYSPGPTTVPPEALSVMGSPMFHHRTKRYRDLFKEVTEGLKYALATENDVLSFTSSGTGAMESSMANIISPGDRVITVNGGKFGERWGEIARAYDADVDEIMVDWGKPVDPDEIKKRLTDAVKAVYVTLCETSTGVVSDIKTIASIVADTQAILVVDTISGLLCDDIRVDEWKVDIAVGGSQKGLMIPPGWAFVSVSEKAWALAESAKSPAYYLSYKRAKKSIATFDNPYTPAVSLARALKVTLGMIRQEGRENLLEHYLKLAKAIRAAAGALSLELFTQSPSNCVTAIKVPDGVDGTDLVKILREKYGVTFAGGQAKLKGKIFRISSMGYLNEFDILTAISALEMALGDLGYKFEKGSGVKAAQEVLSG